MKSMRLTAAFLALVFSAFATVAVAQYDDLYYDPDTDYEYYYGSDNNSNQNDFNSEDYGYDNEEYADDYYNDDYDYYYTSRIRRFNRPASGFGFYDPYYVSFTLRQ